MRTLAPLAFGIAAAMAIGGVSPAHADTPPRFSEVELCAARLVGILGLPPSEAPQPREPIPNDPGGRVRLTPGEFVAILNYIGAPVVGGYASGGRARPLPLDAYGDLRGAQGQMAPKFSVLKKILGTELETNPKFAAEMAKLVETLRTRTAKDKPVSDAELQPVLAEISRTARDELKAKDVSPSAAIANMALLRSAMVRLENPVVRGVINYEVGYPPNAIPKVGDKIAYSSAKGQVMSTNPKSAVQDSIDYGKGKIAREGKGGKVIIMEYSQLYVEGVSIGSVGEKAIDAIETHLATGNNAAGDTFVDQNVKVSRNEIIASPKEDLVVTEVREDGDVVYVKMGPKTK